MSYKFIKLIIASIVTITLPASAYTSSYILTNPNTEHKILIIGLVHTLGNAQVDELMNKKNTELAQDLITKFKQRSNNNTKCIYECAELSNNDESITICDPIINVFNQYATQKQKNIEGFEPRSLWSAHLESFVRLKRTPEKIRDFIIKKSSTRVPTIKECIASMHKENAMISSWNISNDHKQALLDENNNVQKKLHDSIDNNTTTLYDAFFKKNLGETLLEYDYHLADLGYYAKVKDTKENVILIVGQFHVDKIQKLLTQEGYTMQSKNEFITPKEGTETNLIDLSNIFTLSSDYVKKAMNDFLPKAFSCHTCKKTAAELGKALSSCSKCQLLKYCSIDCQKADWPNHKTTCKKS